MKEIERMEMKNVQPQQPPVNTLQSLLFVLFRLFIRRWAADSAEADKVVKRPNTKPSQFSRIEHEWMNNTVCAAIRNQIIFFLFSNTICWSPQQFSSLFSIQCKIRSPKCILCAHRESESEKWKNSVNIHSHLFALRRGW